MEQALRAAVRNATDLNAELRTKTAVPGTTRCRIGYPGVGALAVLDGDRTFDLVVIGSHGRTGIGRALLGSVAEGVARHASWPRARGTAAALNRSV